MEVYHITSRKRETYNVQVKYSILFECALGIAAITHKRLIDTLEKSQNEWEEIKKSLTEEMREHLQFVEENIRGKHCFSCCMKKTYRVYRSFMLKSIHFQKKI